MDATCDRCVCSKNGVVYSCDWIRDDIRVLVACDIQVCAYDIPVYIRDVFVAYNAHNCDGWVSLHADSAELAHDERGNMVCVVRHDASDNAEAYALRRDALGNVACVLRRDAPDNAEAYALPHDVVDRLAACDQDNAMVGHSRLDLELA